MDYIEWHSETTNQLIKHFHACSVKSMTSGSLNVKLCLFRCKNDKSIDNRLQFYLSTAMIFILTFVICFGPISFINSVRLPIAWEREVEMQEYVNIILGTLLAFPSHFLWPPQCWNRPQCHGDEAPSIPAKNRTGTKSITEITFKGNPSNPYSPRGTL